jgi:transcriptional regulator with XRE-family HTH domain
MAVAEREADSAGTLEGVTELSMRSWQPVGERLRMWRESRQFSQLRLATEADISPRHLSYLETGRSAPSREILIRLAEHLDVPAHARNELLLAAGYAPVYHVEDEALAQMLQAGRQVLRAHEPQPAMAVDRLWNLLDANSGFHLFTAGVADHLLEPPVNVLRLTLHPKGLAPRIINLGEWQHNLLSRLRRRLDRVRDPDLAALYDELCEYTGTCGEDLEGIEDILLPLRLRDGDGELNFYCTVTVFGTALDVTVAGVAIKTFYPMDDATARAVRAADPRRSRPLHVTRRAASSRTGVRTRSFPRRRG